MGKEEDVQSIVINQEDVNTGNLVETKMCVYSNGQPVPDAKVTIIAATQQTYNTDENGCIKASVVESENSKTRYIVEKAGYEVVAGNLKNELVTINLEKKRFASIPVVMGILFGLFTVWRIFRGVIGKKEGG